MSQQPARRVPRSSRPVGSIVPLALALLAMCSCEVDRSDTAGRANTPPSIRITGGAVDGQMVDYRVEFFWFGADADGVIDHFVYAIDDTCLCRYEATTTVSTPKGPVAVTEEMGSTDPDSCRAHGQTPRYESADSLWTGTTRFSGSFLFSASSPVDTLETPTANDWHTFYIKSVDNEGARSTADSRYFNAQTVAPRAWLTVPLGTGVAHSATVSSFVSPRWKGHDIDSVNPAQVPVGYQMKLIKLDSTNDDDALTIRYLTSPEVARRNFLVHDTLVVGTPDSLTDETYLESDWWPKRDRPFTGQRLQLEDLEAGPYAFAVRAVDDAGAVMPDRAFRLADASTEGNVVKMSVNPNLPGGPWITVAEYGLGEKTFRGNNEEWRVEVPINVPVRFFWEVDASHYGADPGPVNYALDLADPGCEVCVDDAGVGGWIGWARRDRLVEPIMFTNEQSEEQHVLYIRARDESFSPDRETLAVIVIDVIGFSFEHTALWVDDFKWAGVDDCWHDSTLAPMLETAIAPYMPADEVIDRWATYRPPWQGGEEACIEVNEPQLIPLSRIGRYKMIFWNVSATIPGSGLGALANPAEDAETGTGKHLQNYVAAGGKLLLWGRRLYGALIGDLYPQEVPWLPAIPQNSDPNFGPGSFLWDVLKFRTRLDWVARGTDLRLQQRCSGLIGLEPTPLALDEGYPAGEPDPTGYDPSRRAIWFDDYVGAENPFGARGAVSTVGLPSLHVVGLDTLYTYVTNSWTYQQGGSTAIRRACGTAFLSPFEDEPIVFRSADPLTGRGKIALIGAPFVSFMQQSPGAVQDLFVKLTEWLFE